MGRRIFIVLRVKLILQMRGVEIKTAKDQRRKYAGLKKYVFPHNRLVKLMISYFPF